LHERLERGLFCILIPRVSLWSRARKIPVLLLRRKKQLQFRRYAGVVFFGLLIRIDPGGWTALFRSLTPPGSQSPSTQKGDVLPHIPSAVPFFLASASCDRFGSPEDRFTPAGAFGLKVSRLRNRFKAESPNRWLLIDGLSAMVQNLPFLRRPGHSAGGLRSLPLTLNKLAGAFTRSAEY